MTIAYLSLGSNIEDRIGFLQKATSLLASSKDIHILNSSSIYETQPWGVENQAWFLNAAIEIETLLSPSELLEECLKIENFLGRDRTKEKKWDKRKIDIDILFYGNLISVEKNLVIPHKHLHKRAFVLVPMMEIASDFKHPFFKLTIEELYFNLENPEDVLLYGTKL